MLLAFVLSIHAATGIAAAQDPALVETSLDLNRSTRLLIQQGLRNEGFDPGTPDGLFGPRARAAIREWQQSQGERSTGYLNASEVELLRMAAESPLAVSGASPPPQRTQPEAEQAASVALRSRQDAPDCGRIRRVGTRNTA